MVRLEMTATARLDVDVLSLFPRMLDGFLAESILGRAIRRGILRVTSRSLREWAPTGHGTVDDRPYGGGAGMILKAEPVCRAVAELRCPTSVAIYLCPDGESFTATMARELANECHLILICGHYEGLDERARELAVDREISIGDYVLTNGVLAAAVLIDAVARHVPGVLGKSQSLEQDSFRHNLLSFPQYTRPRIFAERQVPDILLGGDHKRIDAWRLGQQMERTRLRRADLLGKQDDGQAT
ncbi:MAG: tRNA (guanosine(37)-N1)-methyltransferase TrmD [Puniceicoccales bacterium]|nr:tRNA (guanosine(37)-N1)-methyltransferase TrmD [Puniceicoccales bacterium]